MIFLLHCNSIWANTIPYHLILFNLYPPSLTPNQLISSILILASSSSFALFSSHYLLPVIFLILLIICRSLEGVLDDLRSDQLVDGVAIQNLPVGDSDDEHNSYNTLPGANGRKTGGDGSRSTRQTVLTSSIRFSPTGREWAAATTQVRASNEGQEIIEKRFGCIIF